MLGTNEIGLELGYIIAQDFIQEVSSELIDEDDIQIIDGNQELTTDMTIEVELAHLFLEFTNHSGRKTFIQISKSEGISDNDVMSVSRHKNPHSLAYYERPKSILQQNTLSQINSLIYNDTLLSNDKTANSFSSALEIFNESRSPLQQLNSNDLNELNDDQQNQEINGNDETIKKILHGNVFQNCNITFNVNK
ncbi:hypothetical protein RhiirA5_502378 [Rhizophagus irregularis]|uniref:Uncharacterized protein n=2 Tax=Rhizophagus irregularis TaxID=588596 RepID=A0A2N0PE03_9GLOM|nr:hypothetical protein RhiirA5_502378 [Rhizophagus irregularis]